MTTIPVVTLSKSSENNLVVSVPYSVPAPNGGAFFNGIDSPVLGAGQTIFTGPTSVPSGLTAEPSGTYTTALQTYTLTPTGFTTENYSLSGVGCSGGTSSEEPIPGVVLGGKMFLQGSTLNQVSGGEPFLVGASIAIGEAVVGGSGTLAAAYDSSLYPGSGGTFFFGASPYYLSSETGGVVASSLSAGTNFPAQGGAVAFGIGSANLAFFDGSATHVLAPADACPPLASLFSSLPAGNEVEIGTVQTLPNNHTHYSALSYRTADTGLTVPLFALMENGTAASAGPFSLAFDDPEVQSAWTAAITYVPPAGPTLGSVSTSIIFSPVRGGCIFPLGDSSIVLVDLDTASYSVNNFTGVDSAGAEILTAAFSATSFLGLGLSVQMDAAGVFYFTGSPLSPTTPQPIGVSGQPAVLAGGMQTQIIGLGM